MSAELEHAVNEARNAAAPLGSQMAERLLDRVGGVANAKAIFGDPIERDGVTIIPVGQVSWAAGAGGGRGTTTKEDSVDGGEGGGGGGGVRANPIGYIEISEGSARFVRIRDLNSYIPLILVGTFAWWMFVRTLRSLFR